MKDYLETLRSKPEDARRRIALGAAAGFTAVVAIAWMVALSSSGALTLSAPESRGELEATFTEGMDRYNSLAGAASAFYQDPEGTASISIIEEERSSTLDRTETTQSEATVIPF